MRHATTTTTNANTTPSRRPFRARAATLLAGLGLLASATTAHAGAPALASATSWAPHLDRRIVTTRATVLGAQRATWYGPGFYGHRTACGMRLARGTWGIAHRTLPCGTLVTLQRGNRRVSVRVIDRGPYSGASVDLTERTKQFLGFVDGSVRMTQVRRFRVLPKGTR